MARVKDFYNFIDKFAPFNTAEDWDNVGLIVGDQNAEVRRCLVALDVTNEIIDEAIKKDVQLLITHHPLMFKPISRLKPEDLVYKLARNGISLISAHTNLDIANGGVNDTLGEIIGLKNTVNIKLSPDSLEQIQIGDMEKSYTPEGFAKYIKNALGCGSIKYSDNGRNIKRVGICSGSGDKYFQLALKSNADAYITGEVKLSTFVEAKNVGVTIFDAGHFETETIICKSLVEALNKEFSDIQIQEAESNKNPVKYV